MEAGYIIGQLIGFFIILGLTALAFVRAVIIAKKTSRTAWQTIRMVLYFILGSLLALGLLSMLSPTR